MIKTCQECEKDYKTYKSRQKYCSRDCMYDARRGNPTWNAGTSEGWVGSRGYRWIYVTENGERVQRREHRVVMEKHLGRKLEPEEIVHHIDGDRTNNDPSNLEVMTSAEHNREHHTGSERSDQTKRRLAVKGRMRARINELEEINTELLEAAKGLVKALTNRRPHSVEDHKAHAGTVYGEIDNLRAAIQKAEGRDQ